jgi:hypothetical protein
MISSLDGDKALPVDRDDIAHVVQAARQRFDHARILGPIVTEHDIRAAHKEPGAANVRCGDAREKSALRSGQTDWSDERLALLRNQSCDVEGCHRLAGDRAVPPAAAVY